MEGEAGDFERREREARQERTRTDADPKRAPGGRGADPVRPGREPPAPRARDGRETPDAGGAEPREADRPRDRSRDAGGEAVAPSRRGPVVAPSAARTPAGPPPRFVPAPELPEPSRRPAPEPRRRPDTDRGNPLPLPTRGPAARVTPRQAREEAAAADETPAPPESPRRRFVRPERPEPRAVPIAPAPDPDATQRPRRLRTDDGRDERLAAGDDRLSRRREMSRRARRAFLPSRDDAEQEAPEPRPPSRFAGRDGWDAAGPPREPPGPTIGDAAEDAREPADARGRPPAARLPLRSEASPDALAPAAPAPPPRRAAAAPADDEPPAGTLFAARERPAAVVDHTPDVVVEGGPIVAPGTVAGRSLTVVVAIMTFLSVLILGGALLVNRAAEAWSTGVLDEITVTVMPLDGGATERRLTEAADILASTPGVGDVRIGTEDEAEALLEPWLGSDVDLSLLPVPRIVTARVTGPLDRAALGTALAAVEGASLDDHTGWSERLSGMAAAVAGGSIAALLLVLVATALSIVFATRSAIATNAATVEVLHTLGAEDGFIVRAFQRRFLAIGLRGAVAGFGAGVLLFGALDLWTAFSPAATSPQARALFGAPSIGLTGYVLVAAVSAGIAALVAITATAAVRHNLARIAR